MSGARQMTNTGRAMSLMRYRTGAALDRYLKCLCNGFNDSQVRARLRLP